jgi:type IV pilus assembly protein PilW
MSSHPTKTIPRTAPTQSGFTLVELMVTVAIALFLIGGLLTVLQNVRGAYNNQQLLSQLQDQQRFALTVLTDVIQAGGYFPDPKLYQPANSLPVSGNFGLGQAFWGSHPSANGPDTIGVRYRTNQNENVIFCDGSINTTQNPDGLFVNQFTVVPPGQLQCQVTNAATNVVNTVPIVNGVQSLVVYYGVKRNPVPADYNVDTYLTADQMSAADWNNISSVRVILTFTNPLCAQICQPGQQPTIQFERVIEVMSRAGVHT